MQLPGHANPQTRGPRARDTVASPPSPRSGVTLRKAGVLRPRRGSGAAARAGRERARGAPETRGSAARAQMHRSDVNSSPLELRTGGSSAGPGLSPGECLSLPEPRGPARWGRLSQILMHFTGCRNSRWLWGTPERHFRHIQAVCLWAHHCPSLNLRLLTYETRGLKFEDLVAR